MKIAEALRRGAERLRKASERPLLEAELLLSHILEHDRVYLHTRGDEVLGSMELERFRALLERRAANEPLEYLTGRVSFYGREFLIEPGVLIPRPETELLVDAVAGELKGDERLAEIGVGSGAVSVTLKKRFPNLRVIATDISQKALELATKNARLHSAQIELVHTDLLDGLGDVDVIVSNPPYIAASYPLPPNVAYEPREALIGGERGTEVLERIVELFAESGARLLACEMGYDQRAAMEEVLGRYGLSATFYKDLAGLDRSFVAKKER
jgi:release factor glutamine methyltransferase